MRSSGHAAHPLRRRARAVPRSFRQFVDKEIVPAPRAVGARRHRRPGAVRQGRARTGFLGMAVPEEYGGGGRRRLPLQPRHRRGDRSAPACAAPGSASRCTTTSACRTSSRYCTDEQKERWLPGICSGELITAIAMTEPGIGSDLASMTTTAIRDGDHYVVNGSKTFITNGINADLVITAVKTDPTQRHKGMSLLVRRARAWRASSGAATSTRSACTPGHRRAVLHRRAGAGGEPARRRRARASSTSCTTCPRSGCRSPVPASRPPAAALGWTLEYCKERTAFGQPIGSFQNSRFKLAEMRTEIDDRPGVRRPLRRGAQRRRRSPPRRRPRPSGGAPSCRSGSSTRCLQLHGGYGYMLEYPIARAYADARITTIYGGTTEIMKEIIGRVRAGPVGMRQS